MASLTDLYSVLRVYSQTRPSTDSEVEWDALDVNAHVRYHSLKEELVKLGVQLREPLNAAQWDEFIERLNTNYVDPLERRGAHPRLKQILEAVSADTRYRWKYEQKGNETASTSDFSLYWDETLLSHLVAKESSPVRLMQESEACLASRFTDAIELMGGLDDTTSISGLCLGSTGLRLQLSKVTACGTSGALTADRTGGRGPQLWTEKGEPV
jgi:hypothetical protein